MNRSSLLLPGLGSLLLVFVLLFITEPALAQPRITGVTGATTGDEGQMREFTVNTANTDGADLVYVWDFGDGSDPLRVRAASVRHRYSDDGMYTLRVALSASDRVVSQIARTVTIENVDPKVIRLVYDDEVSATRPFDVRVEARDPGDDELTYTWDFGDGTTLDTGTRPQARHIYDKPGAYPLTVRVADGDGGTTTATRDVLVDTDFSLRYSGYLEREMTGITYDYFTQRDSVRVLQNGGYADCTVLFKLKPDHVEMRRVDAPIYVQIIGPFDERTYPIATVTGQRDGSPRTAYFYHKWTFSEADESIRVDPERSTGTLEITDLRGPSSVNPGIDGTFSANLDAVLLERGNVQDVPLRVDGTFTTTLTSAEVRPECFDDRAEPLQVTDHTPRADAQNVHRTDPTIEVTLSKPIDATTVTEETAYLRYLNADNEDQHVPVAATVVGSTLRLVPYDDLLPGVTYDAVLEGGDGGIRGSDDERMDDEYSWPFSTLIEPDSVKVHLFQVARDAKLVPGKSTLTRVYTYWSERDDVHPSAQVTQFGARVRVLDDEDNELYNAQDRVLIERPDEFDDFETRRALNSVNFFGWSPERDQTQLVKAEIEPMNQEEGRTPVRFTGAQNASYWDRSPSLTIEYYILPLGELEAADGPLERVYKNRVRHIAALAADYTMQSFPIVDVDVLGPHLPELGTEGIQKGYAVYRRGLSETGQISEEESEYIRLVKYLQQAIGVHSSADIIVFMVPTKAFNFASGATYTHVGSTPDRDDIPPSSGYDWVQTPLVTMQLHEVVPRTTALTHEFGHAYGLQHLPYITSDENRTETCAIPLAGLPDAVTDIEGFRIAPDGRFGWNKSKTEGNQQHPRLYPLMFPCVGYAVTPTLYRPGQFITNDQYDRLMTGLENGLSADARTGRSGDGLWHARSRWTPSPSPHGLAFSNAPSPRGPSAPLDDRKTSAETVSSLAFTSPTPGETIGGTETVRWTDSAPDSSRYTLLYSPTGAPPWSVQAVGGTERAYDAVATLLQPGPSPTFRVVSNEDGASASVSFQLDRDLAIRRTWPFEGDSVSVRSTVFVELDTELDTELDAASNSDLALSVTAPGGTPVEGTVSYDATEHRIVFTPDEPLDGQATYTATLHAGLTDRYGHRLSETLSWSFHTTTPRPEFTDSADSKAPRDASGTEAPSEESPSTETPDTDTQANEGERRGRFGRFLQRIKERAEEAADDAGSDTSTDDGNRP